MGYHENLFRLFKAVDPKAYRNLRKTTRRRDNVLLDSGHYSTQAWGALNKCWKGFKIAKSEFDMKNMFYYAKGIRKFQRELGIHVMDFPQFGLVGRFVEQERVPVNNWKSGDYRQTDQEIREYEQREQAEDTYGMEQEPDPWKEQEEYMQRRSQECV
jgi:hypothetical protein